MKNLIRTNVQKIKKIQNLNLIENQVSLFNDVKILEYDKDPAMLRVSVPVGLSQFVIDNIRAAKKNIAVKLDVTAAKNYYMLLVAISNMCNNNTFETSILSLSKSTFTGKKDINSHCYGVNNIMFNLSVLEQCGLMHVEELPESRVRISEIKVPELIITNPSAVHSFTSVYFKYQSVCEKSDFLNSISIQSIDTKKMFVNLTAEQVGYLRAVVESTQAVGKQVMLSENTNTDMRIIYLGKMISLFKKEYETLLQEKSDQDNDSSLFPRTSLL